MKHSILIVDDQPNIRKLVSYNVENMGYDVDSAESGDKALEAIKEKNYSAVLLDIQMPGMDGIQTLKVIKEIQPQVSVIMVTAQKELSLAVKSVKLGAFEYLTKPIDFDRLETELKNAIEVSDLKFQVKALKSEIQSNQLFDNIIGKSDAMADVFNLADRVLNSDASVLIIGESGSGKEMLARSIHEGSNRRKEPFVPVNSAAITKELADSLLFGHKKGSFTGANEDRSGYFEQADGGTIFLDEIGDMDLDIQAKVLRVLEEKKVRRVGEKTERNVDFRVVSATNQDLSEFIQEGKFRKDLYYRLEEYPIYLPPLRERQNDVIILAKHFLNDYCNSNSLPPLRFSESVINKLKSHSWPGNIRELKNVVRRAAILETSDTISQITFSNIETAHKPTTPVFSVQSDSDNVIPFEDVERQAIENAFISADRNAVKAAKLLGISRATIYRRLKQYGIE